MIVCENHDEAKVVYDEEPCPLCNAEEKLEIARKGLAQIRKNLEQQLACCEE